MNLKNLLFTTLFSLLLLSCSPVIYYLGDSYSSTSSVQVYYDAKEVKKQYKVMGRMTKEVTLNTERDKKYMIEEAKKRGADGIIFSDLSISPERKQGEQVSVKAELIKFL